MKKYANHPKYGDEPMDNRGSFTKEQIDKSYWQYSTLNYFPKSAILADVSKQQEAIFPRKIYVDIEYKCQECGRYFIFFAQEQRYWYEMLNFYIDSRPKECFECRAKLREKRVKIKKISSEYDKLIKKEKLGTNELNRLKELAKELYEIGHIKNRRLQLILSRT